MPICNKKMTFNECELAILRSSVDTIDKRIAKNIVDSPEIKKLLK